MFFFFQAEDGIRDAQESRGLGDVYKRQRLHAAGQTAGFEFERGSAELAGNSNHVSPGACFGFLLYVQWLARPLAGTGLAGCKLAVGDTDQSAVDLFPRTAAALGVVPGRLLVGFIELVAV